MQGRKDKYKIINYFKHKFIIMWLLYETEKYYRKQIEINYDNKTKEIDESGKWFLVTNVILENVNKGKLEI